MNDDTFLKVAKQAAIEAGKVVKKYYQSELTLHGKGHYADFSTRADLESEKKILQIITTNFPMHNIIAEESGEVDNNSEYTWAIDPIDGTIPFVDGIPLFGVSIGLLKNHKPFIGVINMVATDEMYWAKIGEGAYLNGKKIKVRKESSLQNSTIGVCFGHTERIMKFNRYFKPIIEKVRFIYNFGSAVSVLSFIANGMIDGYIIRANVWDVAAGSILIEEAGGKVTDIEGNSVNWTDRKIFLVASNGLIHDAIVEALK